MKQICKSFEKLNNSELDKIKANISKGSTNKNVYFKDQIWKGKREICFRANPYDRDEVNAYTTNLTTIGFRKLGLRVIGVGKLR